MTATAIECFCCAFIYEAQAVAVKYPVGETLLCPSHSLNPFQSFLLVFWAPRGHVRLGGLVRLRRLPCGR